MSGLRAFEAGPVNAIHKIKGKTGRQTWRCFQSFLFCLVEESTSPVDSKQSPPIHWLGERRPGGHLPRRGKGRGLRPCTGCGHTAQQHHLPLDLDIQMQKHAEMPDTCRREPVSHTYHVDGDAVVQSAEALESAFEDCPPVSRACGNNDIQLSLLQWSVTVGCCSHQEATRPPLLLRIFSGTAQEAAEIYVSRRRWGAPGRLPAHCGSWPDPQRCPKKRNHRPDPKSAESTIRSTPPLKSTGSLRPTRW
jgi:hypothetical protein